MNILTPINSLSEAKAFSLFSNIEFFCGYSPLWWIEKYNDNSLIERGILSVPINNRYEIDSSILTLDELSRIVDFTQKKRIRLYLALNAKHYSQCSQEDLAKYVKEIVGIGIERLIVCDVGLLNWLHDNFPYIKVSISCLNQVTNSLAVKFYENLNNIERVVLPRHMNVEEILKISRSNPDMEFEYFLFSNRCLYDDGYCRAVHYFDPICRDTCELTYDKNFDSSFYKDYTMNRFTQFKDWSTVQIRQSTCSYPWGNFLCSACSLYNTVTECNIKAVKLSIRGKTMKQKHTQIAMGTKIIECAQNARSVDDIKKAMSELYGVDLCIDGMSCLVRGV